MIFALAFSLATQTSLAMHWRAPQIDYPLVPMQKALSFKIERGDWKTSNSYARLDIFRTGTLARSEQFGNYEHSFDRYMGNPQRPPFVVVRTGMRAIVYDLILPWWKPHPQTYCYIRYVSRDSVIAGRRLYTISRAATQTGKIVWERDFQVGVLEVEKTKRGVWATLYDGRELLLDWRTGKTIGRRRAKST